MLPLVCALVLAVFAGRATAAADYKRLIAFVETGRTGDLRQAMAGYTPDDINLTGRAALMMLAIGKNQAETTTALLDWGISPHHPLSITANDYTVTLTPLMLAISSAAKPSVVDALVKGGADVNRAAEGMLPLNFALTLRHYGIAGYLLDHGANVNGADPLLGATPLIEYVMSFQKSGDAEARAMLKRLLDKGADVNARDPSGATALRWAVIAGQHDMVQALLDAGADPTLANHKGDTPLMWAERKPSAETAALLRSYGAAR
jgi:Ankyrin repeats (3 copies)/Ankyrin repeat